MSELEETRDAEQFDRWRAAAGAPSPDPYLDLRWATLWARWDGGVAVGLRLRSVEGTALQTVLCVPLDALPGGGGRIDVRSPYDFGGPWLSHPSLAAAFGAAWDDWLARRGAVTEFVRCHPHWPHGPGSSESEIHQHHQVVELSEPYPTGKRGKQHARDARRAVRLGVRVDFDAEGPAEDFIDLYAATMRRLAAPTYYHFPPWLLRAVVGRPDVTVARARADGATVAAALFLQSGGTWFYFLSASLREARSLCPNNALLDAAVTAARRQGLTRLHLGGGAESLRYFKASVANSETPFRLRKRVLDTDAHAALAAGREETWFPPWYPELHASLTEDHSA